MSRQQRSARRAGPARADSLTARDIALVGAGGALGTSLRLGLAQLLPDSGSLPVAVITINVTGAFALGWLTTVLHQSGGAPRARKAAQLGLGTGVLGGYTTYSAFAVGTDGLLTGSHPAAGLALSLATVTVGVVAARSGAVLAGTPRSRTGAP